MNYKKHLCAALLALVPFTAFSQTTVNTPTAPAAAAADKSVPNAPAAIVQDEKQICDTLKKTLQGKLGIPVESVSVTPVKGVYEVVAQNEIMYSDATADHIIVGQLFETTFSIVTSAVLVTINFWMLGKSKVMLLVRPSKTISCPS